MSRQRFNRALVTALGERGSIQLPLLEQLLPIIDIGNLAALGFPPGLPVVGRHSKTGGAGERGGIIFSAPPGYVIRLDRIQSPQAFHISFGVLAGAFDNGASLYAITDARQANEAAHGSLRGIGDASQGAAAWGAGGGHYELADLAAATWYEGPIYVNENVGALVWANTDASAILVHVHGEAFTIE